VRVTATLISTAPFGLWRFVLAVSDAPGRFLVEKVIQANAALTAIGYPPASTAAGFDISAAGAPIDIRISDDAGLSAYATLAVTFADLVTPTTGLVVGVSTRPYDAIVRTIPGLAIAQSAVEVSSVRGAGGDCLVRAACPVMVSLTAAAAVLPGVILTPAQVSEAVSRAINENGISLTLSAASVAARASAFLPSGTALQLTTWAGIVYTTVGTTVVVTGATGLTVITDWNSGVGPDAVAFYADPEAITSTVITVT
jgi:hypothetical protein